MTDRVQTELERWFPTFRSLDYIKSRFTGKFQNSISGHMQVRQDFFVAIWEKRIRYFEQTFLDPVSQYIPFLELPILNEVIGNFINEFPWNTNNLFSQEHSETENHKIHSDFLVRFPSGSQLFKVKLVTFRSANVPTRNSVPLFYPPVQPKILKRSHHHKVYVAAESKPGNHHFSNYHGSGVALKELNSEDRPRQEIIFYCSSHAEMKSLEGRLIWALKCAAESTKEIVITDGEYSFVRGDVDYGKYRYLEVATFEVLNRGKGGEGRISDKIRFRAEKYYVYTHKVTKEIQIHVTQVYWGKSAEEWISKVMFPESTNDAAEFLEMKHLFLKGYLKMEEPSAKILTEFF